MTDLDYLASIANDVHILLILFCALIIYFVARFFYKLFVGLLFGWFDIHNKLCYNIFIYITYNV